MIRYDLSRDRMCGAATGQLNYNLLLNRNHRGLEEQEHSCPEHKGSRANFGYLRGDTVTVFRVGHPQPSAVPTAGSTREGEHCQFPPAPSMLF